ncbi:MAG: chemotaxis protein CheW [Spirochaetia bacterium]|nr:chemotaxis protein CheW [Spirochaetia bacterium]
MATETEFLEKTMMDLEEAKSGTNMDRQFLTFQMGPEEYGINILNVKEIIGYSQVTKIPMVPEYILGVMNVRGNVVPVVDLAPRFGSLTSPVTKLTCIVIVEIEEGEDVTDVGILVDSVEDVVDISKEDVESAPGFGAKLRADFISGIGKIGDRFVILLNIDRVLDLNELSRFDQYKRSIHIERALAKKESLKNNEDLDSKNQMERKI